MPRESGQKGSGVLGVLVVEGGARHQRNNREIRRGMGINSVWEEMKVRRLIWLEDMLRNPDENMQVRAAIGGELEMAGRRVEGEFTPWLMQMEGDVQWILQRMVKEGRREGVEEAGVTLLRWKHA